MILLEARWYVTHAGLLRLARRKRCSGIRVQPVRDFCDPNHDRWVFAATVFTSRDCKGFAGYGDADVSNVSSLVRARRCGWPRPAPLTEPCARPMASVSARWRR